MTPPITQRAKVTWTSVDSAGGAACTVTMAAVAGHAHVIKKIIASFSAVTTAVETIVVTAGSTVIATINIPSGSVGPHQFDFGLQDDGMGLTRGVLNEAVTVVLSAGGGALVGTLVVGSM